EAYRGLGNVFLEKKEYDKAIKTFKKALDLAPQDLGLLNSLGLSYVKKGYLVKGIDHYKLALRIDAANWQVLFNIGFAEEKRQNFQMAITYYERALASNPDLEKAERRIRSLKKAS